jgi:hypothetical protein
MSDHQRIERQSAAMHQVIAARIRTGDSLPIERARSNLERWCRQFGGVLPPAYVEWQDLLDRGIDTVVRTLEADDQNSIRLRSSSPFTGILTPRERWDILRRAA